MKWLEPWEAIDALGWGSEREAAHAAAIEAQLSREVGPAHVLHGRDATLLARRFDRDDFLFRLDDGRIAEVHLTNRGSAEPDPRWPTTRVFASLAEWDEARQRPARAMWELEGPHD